MMYKVLALIKMIVIVAVILFVLFIFLLSLTMNPSIELIISIVALRISAYGFI
ncbi:hypothetical protein [Carnobacterium sp. TMP28]|uniref:hypothetical protein n=1 Tax=Carnobacterium sp. TMP28 TaxID=3397060 RepID=UPI0039E0B289